MIQKKWSQEEIEYLTQHNDTESYAYIGSVLGRTESSVMHKAHKLGLKKSMFWKNDEIQYLIDNYKTKTYKEISEYLGRSKCAVDLKISQLGLKKSIYTFQHNYFHTIDTEEKAYWLGFISADGNVRFDKGENYQLVIKLAATDGNHLKKFNKSISGNLPVRYSSRPCPFSGIERNIAEIRACSKEMTEDLISHGVVPCKSLVIQFPILTDQLMHHYIRGYYDGNGSMGVYKSSNKKNIHLKASIVSGSLDFIKSLREYLYSKGICTYLRIPKPTHAELQVQGLQNANNFFNYMYKDATIFLDRKLEKKQMLYEKFNIEQRLLRLAEMRG